MSTHFFAKEPTFTHLKNKKIQLKKAILLARIEGDFKFHVSVVYLIIVMNPCGVKHVLVTGKACTIFSDFYCNPMYLVGVAA